MIIIDAARTESYFSKTLQSRMAEVQSSAAPATDLNKFLSIIVKEIPSIT
jgi:hypothetical protein